MGKNIALARETHLGVKRIPWKDLAEDLVQYNGKIPNNT